MFGLPIHDVIAVRHLGDHRLHLIFAGGIEGDVDVAKMIEFRGIFAPLRNVEEFRQVFVDPEAGTIVWPNGADLDPLVLYAAATNQRIESLLATASVK